MTIPLPIPRRIALIVLLFAGLAVLADGAARLELAQAVSASTIGARMVAVEGG